MFFLKLVNAETDFNRKFNICCVTKPVGENDGSLRTGLRVKGPGFGNYCPPCAQALRACMKLFSQGLRTIKMS